jgi:hypothetical protein
MMLKRLLETGVDVVLLRLGVHGTSICRVFHFSPFISAVFLVEHCVWYF